MADTLTPKTKGLALELHCLLGAECTASLSGVTHLVMIVDFSDNGLQLNIVLQDRESGSGCTLTFLLQRSS